MKYAAPAGRRNAPETAAASEKFGRYKNESEQGVRIAKVKMNPAIEAISRMWLDCTQGGPLDGSRFSMYGRPRFSARDIEGFTLTIRRFQEQEGSSNGMGRFLNTLMTYCEDDHLTIHTFQLTQRIDELAFDNMKAIIVRGDAGQRLGYAMKRGSTPPVEGDVGIEARDLVGAGAG